MNRTRDQRGFTLIEVAIAVVIFGIVGLALFQILDTSRTTIDAQSSLLEAQQNARVALNTVGHDFRHVSYGKDATQPSIYYADTDSVVFVADLFQDIPGAEVISYYLSDEGDPDTQNPNDTILMKTVTDTMGNVLINAPQSYGMSSSGFQMRYFNGNSVEIPVPVAQPELIGEVQVNVSGVSPRPRHDGSYETVNLSTTIYPRNLPLTPARSRPRPPGPGPVSAPDCESITLNWITPSENTDGSVLDFNDISHFNVYVGTGLADMTMNARLARTFNVWTIAGLTSGSVYTIHVTCVSRNGVESYPWVTTTDLTSGFTPIAPVNVVADVSVDFAVLTWDAVTEFTDGSMITVDVGYEVHRDTAAGFTLTEDTLLGTVGAGVTEYEDSTIATCELVYYRVAAIACGNVGDGSVDISAITPAPPACVSNIGTALGIRDGEANVDWDGPFTRINGATLDPADVDHYTVYYDSIPGSYADSLIVPGGGSTSGTITGLALCTTYYINVRATDACSSPGRLCTSNEATISTTSPCDPGPPAVVTNLTASVGSNQVDLTWDANTADCDLAGYRIHYGYSNGGPYNGVGATQGNSPITVVADDVTTGAFGNFRLDGMDMCADLYMVVSAIDVCIPANEGPISNQVVASTSCDNCDVAMSCSEMAATGFDNDAVMFGVYTVHGDQNVTKLRPTYPGSSSRWVTQISFEDQVVWDASGAFGGGGGTGGSGNARSGDELPVEPFVIDSINEAKGHWVTLQFNENVSNEEITVDFYTDGQPCTIRGVAKPALMTDDFNDGNYNGWTVSRGNWTVTSSGHLRQTESNSSNSQWIYTSNLSWGGDFIFETDMLLEAGLYCIMQFSRYASGERYVGFLWKGREAHFAEMTPDYSDIFGVTYNFLLNEWHRTRVEKEGTTYRFYSNCELLIETSIFPEPPPGRFGFGSFTAEVEFDDVVIVER